MLDREYQYYLNNKEELLKDYNGKYIVISEDKVIGVYESEDIAYFETIKEHKLGTFLIKLCEPDDMSQIHTYHSRVVFA